MVPEELLDPLRRVLRWLASLRDAEGRIVCPEHRVEHSGKNAGAIVIALELLRLDPAADATWLRELAVQQGRRLVANLVNEPSSPCYTFRPGWHDPYNCSNSVIDGGACSDALAQLVRDLGPSLDASDRGEFQSASLLHARTYLRYAALDKGVPAQRAWGLTGLAAANALERDPVLTEAAHEAVRLLAGVQHADGSYPYHPLEWGAGHPGSADVSAYYQSRVTAFLSYALECLGRDPAGDEARGQVERGLDFLLGLSGPDGIKCGLVEAKPWYWGANYELASHPFDVYALARGWRHYGRADCAVAALRSFRAWAGGLSVEGRPSSHEPTPGTGRSYQCAVFWAGHAMWAARALEDLERIGELSAAEPDGAAGATPSLRVWQDAQLARLEDEHVIAWVRGSRPPGNWQHGSPHGAGLLRVVRKQDGAELLERQRFAARQEGEWSARGGGLSPSRGWRSGAQALRFSLWLARVHGRAGRWGEAVAAPFEALGRGVFDFAASEASSAFCRNVRWTPGDATLALEGTLARRDGSPLPGAQFRREFTVDGRGLFVQEGLTGAAALRDVDYLVPAVACESTSTPGSISYRLA